MDYSVFQLLWFLGLLHVLGRLYRVQAEATCYTADGTADSNTPCTTGSNYTFCCSDGYYCLSNGLCEWQNGSFWIGTCTDKNWTSSACPSFCDIAGNPEMWECSTSGGTFCCGSSTCCDESQTQSYSITTLGQVSTIGFISNGVLTPLTPSTSSTSTSTAHSTTPTTTATRSASTTSVINSSNTTPTSSPSPLASSSPSSSPHTGAIAGGVVGGVAAIAGVTLATFCFFKQRKNQRTSAGISKPSIIGSPVSEPLYHELAIEPLRVEASDSGVYELHGG